MRCREQSMDLTAMMSLMVEDVAQDLGHGQGFFLARHVPIAEVLRQIGLGVAVDDGAEPLVLADPRGA